MRKFCLLVAMLFCSPSFAEQEEASQETVFQVSGSLRTVFEFEEDEIAGSDLDFSSYLRLNIQPLVNEHVSPVGSKGESTLKGKRSCNEYPFFNHLRGY